MYKIFIILLVCGVQNRNVGVQSSYGLAIAKMTKSSINFVPDFRCLIEKAKDRKYMKIELYLSLPKISSLLHFNWSAGNIQKPLISLAKSVTRLGGQFPLL